MKTIQVPASIKVGDDEISFQHFLRGMLLDPQLSKDMETLFMTHDVRQKVSVMNGKLELENAEYDLLMRVAKAPTGGYQPLIAQHIVPFLKALKDAG